MAGSPDSDPVARAASWRSPRAVRFTGSPGTIRAAYEHPWLVRTTHWLTAISLVVLVASGLEIFTAFPSFGPKVPEADLFNVPAAFRLGGGLAGALRWHFTFMWIFVASGVTYVTYQAVSGRHRMVLFLPRDIAGVWPMVEHYFFFRAKPPVTGPYNPLQKLAYTSSVCLGAASVLTGIVLFNPVQFSWLAWPMGGFSTARVWHLLAMCGFLAFVPGHLVMVAIHGWKNLVSMLVGWKRDPEYAPEPFAAPVGRDLVPETPVTEEPLQDAEAKPDQGRTESIGDPLDGR